MSWISEWISEWISDCLRVCVCVLISIWCWEKSNWCCSGQAANWDTFWDGRRTLLLLTPLNHFCPFFQSITDILVWISVFLRMDFRHEVRDFRSPPHAILFLRYQQEAHYFFIPQKWMRFVFLFDFPSTLALLRQRHPTHPADESDLQVSSLSSATFTEESTLET